MPEEGYAVCVILFDVRKAFDRVLHRSLLLQLQSMNLNPNILRWLYNYLSERSQLVAIQGETSNTLLVVSAWCLARKCVGPLLFLSYINDVATVVPRSEINMFADDIALYRIIKTPLDYRALQDDVNSIGSLMATKHLEIVYKNT